MCQAAGVLVGVPAGAGRFALTALSAVLAHARRVTLPGTGHAADNSGKPKLVAAQLRAFFS